MNLHVINTGYFKLDGGAMFGVVPKTLWHKLNPADENNMCTWAMRCLLIENGKQLILIDTGIGNKQDDRFFNRYYLHGNDTLLSSLKQKGFQPNDITDVVFTHLHFDHCGGAIKYDENKKLVPVFSNAKYWCSQSHWDLAINPNQREKASFLTENILPIQQTEQLHFINPSISPFQNISFFEAFGHTESMLLPIISYKQETIMFMADLLPSAYHIPMPYVMGYDMKPLETLKEKELILNKAQQNNWTLFLEHDPISECCNLTKTEKGIALNQTFALNTVL